MYTSLLVILFPVLGFASKAPAPAMSAEGPVLRARDCPAPPSSNGYLWLNGVNLAGAEFGTDTGGKTVLRNAYPPTGGSNPNGYGQVDHFYHYRYMNAFRYPVSWQYLINSNSKSATINTANFDKYNGLIQQCLDLSPDTRCIVDIHNYARFEDTVLKSSDGTFADFWANLAQKWKGNPKRSRIIFELMNEPHDVDMNDWVQVQQQAVNKIRGVMGNNDNIILLAGTDWTHAGGWVAQSASQLAKIKNPSGSAYDNLIFSVHDYFQGDNVDPSASCTGRLQDVSSSIACWLRQNRRQAMFTEVGGGPKCVDACMSSLRWLAQNSDVFIGYTAWAAGSFPTSYIMSAVPDADWSDRTMVRKCYQNGPSYNVQRG